MAAAIDVRAGLAAELRRLVRGGGEWPIRDRRRFRNLLLDAVTSDAMPLAELLMRVHDDGMLRLLPSASASRSAWDAAAARLASDLQSQRFVEPGVARFVADAWVNALGPDPAPSARVAAPRPVVAPRQPMRPPSAPPPPRPAPPSAPQPMSAASLAAYRQTNMLMIGMAVVVTLLIVLAFRQTSQRAAQTEAAAARQTPDTAAAPVPVPVTSAAVPVPAVDSTRITTSVDAETTAAVTPEPRPERTVSRRFDVQVPPARPAIPVAPRAARVADDIVLKSGRVFEGRVLSVRPQTVVVRDDDSALEFELAKADVERVVTRDGRVMRFGADNAVVVGDGDLTPLALEGRYRLRYSERWGTERADCAEMARRFAPGADLVVRHLRGAPMMKLEFVGGQGYNAAVRPDGLFETGSDIAPTRGPSNSFVSARLSGRITRGGAVTGVARLNAVTADGAVLCDLALTVRGERLP
jgi:hypothetical protein